MAKKNLDVALGLVAADKAQYLLGEGPCVAAIYTDDVLVSGDVGADDRWPRWGRQAVTLGIGSVISVHLYTDADSATGALKLYSTGRRDYTEDDRDLRCPRRPSAARWCPGRYRGAGTAEA